MKNGLPTVGVVLPTHNREGRIGKSIESVLNQTYEDFELLVIDDGSTDGTYEAVRPYLEDKRVTYIYLDKGPGTGAYPRNWGILLSKGRYVAFLDDDDEWLPTKLEKLLPMFEEDKVGAVYSDAWMVKGSKITYRQTQMGFLPGAVTSTIIVRRECFEKVGGFDTRFVSFGETELLFRISLYYQLSGLSEPLVNYYRDKGTRSTQKKAHSQGLNLLLDKHFDVIRGRGKEYLAYFYAALGGAYFISEEWGKGRQFFLKAIKTNKFAPSTLLFLATILSSYPMKGLYRYVYGSYKWVKSV